MADLSKVVVTSSPHIRHEDNTQQIMLDVIIALMPALAIAIYVFGLRALVVTLVSAAGCVFFEWLYQMLMKKPVTIADLSAVVTGILLAYCLPVSAPLWMVLIGDAFAIVIVKQLFGGIGKNFMNPALSARAFLMGFPADHDHLARHPHQTAPVLHTRCGLHGHPAGGAEKRRHARCHHHRYGPGHGGRLPGRSVGPGPAGRRPVPAQPQGHHPAHPGGLPGHGGPDQLFVPPRQRPGGNSCWPSCAAAA